MYRSSASSFSKMAIFTGSGGGGGGREDPAGFLHLTIFISLVLAERFLFSELGRKLKKTVKFYARNDEPGRMKMQHYLEVLLKQLGSQRPKIYQGRVSAQIFQPRPMDKIQEGILISSAYFSPISLFAE
ncbi:hypothetical protein GQ457_10G011890 [Hibiscus cannabinus]